MPDPTPFRWDDLKLFLAAYRTRSLTRAASEIGLNQSTVSRRLSGFEETLGAPLFDRTSEGLRPTPLAERLREPAERAEAASLDVLRCSEGLGERAVGDVTLAVTEGLAYYLLAPALPELLARHPGLRLSFLVDTESADLGRREADLAIRFYRPTQRDLVAKRAWIGGYRVLAAPALAEQLGPGPHPLAGLPFVGWGRHQAHYPECAWEIARGVLARARATSMTTRVALAQAGVGCIQWPGERLPPGLIPLDTEPLELTAACWIVTHQNSRSTARVSAVWTWIEQTMASLSVEESA